MAETKSQPASHTDVVIIGAGPYGLSIAAHLSALGVSFRIFGSPMSVWREHMPKGMRLKSEGFASSLSDARGEFTLQHYCQQEGIPYQHVALPVELKTFISYGLAFQKKFVPNLEEKRVAAVEQSPEGFTVQLEDGEKVSARRVVVAVGISYYDYVPPILKQLPAGLVSHSSSHSNLEGFKGRSVAVIGAGGSALDLAGLLHEAGASVEVIVRDTTVRFQDPPGGESSLMQRLLKPRTGIGSSKQLYFYCKTPHLFRFLPEALRLDRVRRVLGPAPPWFTKEQIDGKVPFHLGVRITGTQAENGRAVLLLTDAQGRQKKVETDHVIAATGYQVDIERLQLLSPAIRQRIRLTGKAPALSAYFESSVPRLYFVGVSSANMFGPMMRFAFGADYTARRIGRYLAKPHKSMSSLYTGSEHTRAAERV